MPEPPRDWNDTKSGVAQKHHMRIRSEITVHSQTDELHAHRHFGAYVALVLEGGYNELSTDGAWMLEPGDVVVHPPHHLHANCFIGKTKVLNLCIPDEDESSDEFQSYSVLRPSCSDEILRKRIDSGALREELRKAETVDRPEPDNWVDAMARDLAADASIRIADLARRYSVTIEHVSRRFRHRYFMTPSTYRMERRFRYALELLRLTQHSLSEIAHIAGYSDHAHFCRNCMEITGYSPGSLRRRFS